MSIAPRKARAAVLTGPRQIEIREFPLPEIGEHDGLLRVEACGVCASDVPPFLGGEAGTYSGMKLPVILGHEIAGRIERIGPRAAQRWGVTEGDRIIIERWIPCGHCEHCYSGNYRLCVRKIDGMALFYGGSPTDLEPALWGGYAEYLYLHPDAVVYKVSDRVPAELLPLFTPIANGLSWVTIDGGARVGSTVVIQGPGQEGLGAVIAARQAGADRIIVTGLSRDAFRLKLARELGATDTIVADLEDVAARVHEITGGRMADVVLDLTSGPSPAPFEMSLELAAQGGTVVLAAAHDGAPASIRAAKIVARTLTVKGVWGRHRESVKAALRLIESGRFPLEKLCTHRFALEQTSQALSTVAQEQGSDVLQVCVVP